MQRRDRIIIQKVISEINIGQEMLGDMTAHKYQTLRMKDVYQTAKEDFPALLDQLSQINESS